MAQGGPSRSPASDPGTTYPATPDDPPEALIMDPIASEWQKLASMDRQSLDFLPLLSTLTAGGNQSPTTKLRGENARIVLNALDEVSFPFTVVEWPDSNLFCTIYQVFRTDRIPRKYERDTRSAMRALAHDSCQVPLRYQVKPDALGVEREVLTSGASSEIRRGRLGDMIIAVKTLKSYGKINHNDAQKVCAMPKLFFGVY